MRLEVDGDLCIGSQNCVHLAPEVFELGDDGLAHVRVGVVLDPADLAKVVSECPTAAIRVRDTDGI
jgi:ferredoxin